MYTLQSHPAQLVSHASTHDSSSTLLSVSSPGSQTYHSVVCILVQFLMLRLMGRTVTNVLSSFIFQMVRCFFLLTLVYVFICCRSASCKPSSV